MENRKVVRLLASVLLSLAVGACGESVVTNPTTKTIPTGPAPMLIPSTGFTQVVRGFSQSCALSGEATITCWSGVSVPPSTSPPTEAGFVHLTLGTAHGCGLRWDGTIACWGNTSRNQLVGIPTEAGFNQVETLGSFTCALSPAVGIRCWGDNTDGQLNGIPQGTDYVQLAVGGNHACALASNGSVRCWGLTGGGSVATNTPPTESGFVRIFAGPHVTCARTATGRLTCWGNNSRGELNGVPPGDGYTQVAVGFSHTCALRESGAVTCWGDGTREQLTNTPTETGFTHISTASDHTCALTQSGSIRCWGANTRGQLDGVPVGEGFSGLSVGPFGTCVIAPDKSVRCWGDGERSGRIPGTILHPVADFEVPTVLAEGTDLILTLANASVPGYTGEPGFQFAFFCPGSPLSPYGPNNSINCGPFDNGIKYVRGFVRDMEGDESSYLRELTIMNVAPTLGPFSDPLTDIDPLPKEIKLICELPGLPVFIRGSFSDPGSTDQWTVTAEWGDGSPAAPAAVVKPDQSFVLAKCYAAAGAYTVTVTVADDDGGSDTKTFQVNIGNTTPGTDIVVTPPDQTTGAPSPVNLTFENVTGGGTTTVTSGTVGGGGGPPPPANFRLGSPPTYFDIQTSASYEGVITVCLSYAGVRHGNESQLKLLHGETDASGAVVRWVDVTISLDVVADIICGRVASLSPFLAAEANAAPIVQAVRLPSDPVAVGVTVSITAPFTDANPDDAHTASIEWESTVSSASIAEANGVGTVFGSQIYAQPGVYTVGVRVTDGFLTGSRSSVSDLPAYIVVYDPSAGFVTGGGWITSAAGSYALNASSAGKANFGFVAKYKHGATSPDGSTEFQFIAGGLNFRSTAYDWLAVGGSRAQFKGQGTVNGTGGYGFLLSAVDGQSNGTGIDRFRIKIWNRTSGAILYDNQMGAAEDSDATTALGGGSIVIHKK